jgi:PKD repeat protein
MRTAVTALACAALLSTAGSSSADLRPGIFEGRFELNIRVVHAQNITGIRVGQHMTRGLRIRRTCRVGRCSYSFAVEDKYGTFSRQPLQALSAAHYRGSKTYRRTCGNGGRATAVAVLDIHVVATAIRNGRRLVSRLTGTLRSRSTGCTLSGYEAWTFTAARTDLPEALPPPTASFDVQPTSPTVAGNRNTVFFSDQSDGQIVTYAWDFGDPASGGANASDQRNPQHTYAAPGVYRVTLTVSDQRGLTDEEQQVIEIAA